MQNFIKLQNILIDPKKSFEDFKVELIKSQISQFTYLSLLLNIAVTIKRVGFNFQLYLDLLINFKNQPGYRSSCINYTGYKDKISILMNACEKSISTTVNIKLHYLDPNQFNVVYYAIKNPDQNEGIKILDILVSKSPQIIQTATSNGYSPLFLAVQKLRTKIVDFLLSNQLDPNQKLISNGNTGLHQLAKISSKYCLDDIKKMIEIFLKYGFDLGIKNNLEKTVQEYAYDLRFNMGQIIHELLKSSKTLILTSSSPVQPINHNLYQSSQATSQTYYQEAQSSKRATTKIGDVYTTYNNSQFQSQHQLLNQIDTISISNKSLLSDINHSTKYQEENQQQDFSVDMNVHQSQNLDEIEDLEFEEDAQRKMQCHSHSDSPNSDFQLKQAQIESKSISNAGSSSSEEDQEAFLKTQNIDFQKMQRQVLQFDQISYNIYLSAWREIQPFFIKLNQIIQPLNLVIQIIGSFATGLWTHLSDIDIGLITTNQNYVDFERVVEKIYGKLHNRMYHMGIKLLNYNKSSKIPSIKIEMDTYLYSSRKIDIAVFNRKNPAIYYVNFIRESISVFPHIRSMFFFLKRICEQFKLHDPFNGGMKSYTIFLMINEMVRTINSNNLGEILLKMSLYFGFYHQYDYEMEYQSCKQFQIGKQWVPVLRLNILDPLNVKNNMGGKSTNGYRVRNMFRVIYYGLHNNIKNGITALQYILQMIKTIQ